jgi:hypothetical protein
MISAHPLDTRSRELFDRGCRDLESRFDPKAGLVRSPFQPGKHQPHPSIWYAHCLLLRDDEGDAQVAEGIIACVLDLQELRDGDPHRGNFRWFAEDEVVTDLNACQFVVEALVHLLIRLPDRLSQDLLARIFDTMRLAFDEAGHLDVHWTYTNIDLMDAANSILGGQVLNLDTVRRRGEQRLSEWALQTKEAGAPHEFNSPTYSAVQINALAAVAQFAQDKETRRLAVEMEEFVWRHVASFWHASTMQLGGPHSRAYRRDVAGAPGFLKVVIYKILGEARLLAPSPYYSGPDSEGEVQVALTEYHCPPDAKRMLHEMECREVRQQVGRGQTIAADITPEFALGTMLRPYGVGEPPEAWPQHNSCVVYYAKKEPPGLGVQYCRYRVNAGQVGVPSRDSLPAWLDIWDDGFFRTTQDGGRAIVVYGLAPRGQRPIEALRLDIRFMGAGERSSVLIGERLSRGGTLDATLNERIVVADGEAYIGVIPLKPTQLGGGPPVTVWRDGQELVISIVNYEGPAKVFWEYRSLAGPLYKGNVRNGFALWVAPRSEYESPESFAKALAASPLRDETSGSRRRVELGDGPERLVLEYDLMELRP